LTISSNTGVTMASDLLLALTGIAEKIDLKVIIINSAISST